MIVVGAISGTSVDGIDVAAAEFTGAGSPELRLRALGSTTVPWSPGVRRRLLAVLPPAPCTVEELCHLEVLVGEEVASAVTGAISEFASVGVDLVVSHGQTVFHWVEGPVARGGLQLGQAYRPQPAAERCPAAAGAGQVQVT